MSPRDASTAAKIELPISRPGRPRATGLRTFMVITLLTLWSAVAAHAQPAGELFTEAPPPEDDVIQELLEPEVVRLAFVFAELDLIGGPEHVDGAEALSLALFEDVQLTVLKDRLERRSSTSYSWFGQVAGDQESRVILVVREDSMAGTVLVADRIYQVLALDHDPRHAVREIDQSKFIHEEPVDDPDIPGDEPVGENDAGALPPEAPGDMPWDRFRARSGGRERRTIGMTRIEIQEALAGVCDDDDYIDVMVVYTEDADDAPGDILAEIQAAIDDANQSYINSGIVQRLRLVHAEEIVYAESGDAPTDRNRLKDPVDGFMDGVHILRDTYGADIVSLWTRTSNYCGYAYIMGTVTVTFEDRAFNVVKLSCTVNNHSFAHELGHNMSARHDRFVDNTDGSPFGYNHGFANVTDDWRTIMSYNDVCVDGGTSCTRLQYWSNPDVTFGGDPMGIATGDPAAADNRMTLNDTRATVQAFRTAHAPNADAGPDQIGECGQPTLLDGSGSCDPDDDPLTFTWTGGFAEGGGTTFGVMPVVTFPKGIHPVTLVVSDGLIDSVPDMVTVDATDDSTPPDITCPRDVLVSCDEPTDPASTGEATAEDLCDSDPEVDFTDNEIPGDCPQEKIIERTWTAEDDDGNDIDCTQQVTVDDSTAPEVTCGVAVDELWPPNHNLVDVGFGFEADDDCDSEPDVSISVSSDEHPALATGAGGPNHCPDAVVDENGVRLRAERSGAGDGRVYVITVTVTDACGNANSCEATIRVPKSQSPGGAAVDSGQAFDATVCE